jgi:hypothetical protein
MIVAIACATNHHGCPAKTGEPRDLFGLGRSSGACCLESKVKTAEGVVGEREGLR